MLGKTSPCCPALQLHRRLHLLDTQRRQHQDKQMAEYVREHAATLLVTHAPHPYKPEPADEESDADEADADASGSGQQQQGFSAALRGFFDPEVRRQKQAKAAVLAIRKHLVAARHGRVSGRCACCLLPAACCLLPAASQPAVALPACSSDMHACSDVCGSHCGQPSWQVFSWYSCTAACPPVAAQAS
jgi:hypothetical protein